MTTASPGEVNKLPVVPSIDISGAKERQTGLSKSDRYFFITNAALRSADKIENKALRIAAKVGIYLATAAATVLNILQPIVGNIVHHLKVRNVKEFVDPVLNTLDKYPLTPETRKAIQERRGVNVSIAIDPNQKNFIRAHDKVLMAIDKDPVSDEVEKQAERIVEKLAKIDPSQHAEAIKAVVEAVVNRTNLHEDLSVERKEEVATELYNAILDKYLDSQAAQIVTTLVDTSEITEFAKNVDTLASQIAQVSPLEVQKARSVAHEEVREQIEKAEVKIEGVSLEEYVTTSEQALKNTDTERNLLNERIALIKEEFGNLVAEKAKLEASVEDFKRNKSVAEVKEILSNELKEINKDREALRKKLKNAQKSVGKKLKKKTTPKKKKVELDAENHAKVESYKGAISALSAREKAIMEQMSKTDEEIQSGATPYDQRLAEIEVELVSVSAQLKASYTDLENFVVNNEIKVEAFKRVMALINDNSDSVDYTKSLSEISADLALELIESSKDDLEAAGKYQETTLTDYDAFLKFFQSVDYSSSTARAAVSLFFNREDMTIAQKDKFAEITGKLVYAEDETDDFVKAGHEYLIAYINGDTLTADDVQVLPSAVFDVMTSEDAKAASEFVPAPVVEEVEVEDTEEEVVVEEKTEEVPSFGSNVYNFFFGSATAKA